MITCFTLLANLELTAQQNVRDYPVEKKGQKVLVRIQGGPSAFDGMNILLIPGHEYTHMIKATPSKYYSVGGTGKAKGVEHIYPPEKIDLERPEHIRVSFVTDIEGEEEEIMIEIPFLVVGATVVTPREVQDGLRSERFFVVMHPPAIQPQEWQWEWQPLDDRAARLPEEDPYFSDPQAEKPVVTTANWHSETGSTLVKGEQGDVANGASPQQARHQIRCNVTIGNGIQIETPWELWNVFVYKRTPGVEWPDIVGTLSVDEIKWEKAPEGDGYVASIKETAANPFTRTAPKLNVNDMVEENSFYKKIIVVHEGEHMKQWSNEGTEWFPLYQPATLWDVIRNLTATGPTYRWAENKLRTSIRNKAKNQYALWENDRRTTWWKRELEAHTLSNEEAPLFLNSNLDFWKPGVVNRGDRNRTKPNNWPLSR